MAIEELGRGDPLVLVHGLATTRAIWNLVVPALARHRRVVTLDVPGFGESEPVGDGFDLNAVADRIARALPPDTQIDLVGHSLGAGVALTIAVQHPQLVRRLVLVAPAGLASIPRLASIVGSATVEGALAARRALGGLTDLRWGRRLLLAFAAADPAALSPAQARMMVDASASARRTAAALAAITAADLRPKLVQTAAPLGVIWGAEDRTIGVRNATIIEAARRDAVIEIIDRAGHVLMVERPDEFVAALHRLLSRLPKDATTRSERASTLPS